MEAGSTSHPSAQLTRLIVWAGATIGAGVELSNCIVAGDVRVPAGFRADNAMLLPALCLRPTIESCRRTDWRSFLWSEPDSRCIPGLRFTQSRRAEEAAIGH